MDALRAERMNPVFVALCSFTFLGALRAKPLLAYATTNTGTANSYSTRTRSQPVELRRCVKQARVSHGGHKESQSHRAPRRKPMDALRAKRMNPVFVALCGFTFSVPSVRNPCLPTPRRTPATPIRTQPAPAASLLSCGIASSKQARVSHGGHKESQSHRAPRRKPMDALLAERMNPVFVALCGFTFLGALRAKPLLAYAATNTGNVSPSVASSYSTRTGRPTRSAAGSSPRSCAFIRTPSSRSTVTNVYGRSPLKPEWNA